MKDTKSNLTIYSNGIGVFEREYNTEEEREVTIPLKRESLPTAIQTFVHERLRMVSPPSFASGTERPAFQINGENVLLGLTNNLKGANIVVKLHGSNQPVSGKLLGCDKVDHDHGTYKTEHNYIAIINDNQDIINIDVKNIASYKFTDHYIQEEITKALKWSLEQTKPHSTSLTFKIASDGRSKTGVVRFGVPLSSPKPSYRIRQFKNNYWFDLCSVVNNPTEEKWQDTIITVVSGQPISVDTDITEPKMPLRERINIIPDRQPGGMQPRKAVAKMRSVGGASPPLSDSFSFSASGAGAAPEGCAQDYETTLMDVGDFSTFTCKEPQTIDPGKAALIVLHSGELTEAELILCYRWDKKSFTNDRAYRTIKAKNNLPYALSRGNYAVYQQTSEGRQILMGENVLDGFGLGETIMVPHAIETGVRFSREVKPTVRKVSRIKISDGIVSEEETFENTTLYRITNNKKEDFLVYIEHDSVIPYSEMRSDGELIEKTKDGCRFSTKVRAESEHVFSVSEHKTQKTKIELGNQINWLKKTIIDTNHELVRSPQLQNVIHLQEELDKTDQRMAEMKAKEQTLEARNATIRANLSAGGHGPDMDSWKTILATNDRESNDIATKDLPTMRAKRVEQVAELTKALKNLSINYGN